MGVISRSSSRVVMRSLNFEATVIYIRQLSSESSCQIANTPMTLADAVRMALAEHKCGECPVIIGGSIELIGIDAVRAVRALKDFPKA